jgi:hypothetical protein
MELDRYDIVTSESGLDYTFFSKGPNGKIIKKVNFRPTYVNGFLAFNLAFGDWDEKNEQLDDLSISNNKDVKKVLATIAFIVLNFTERFRNSTVHAKGSTSSRTRLYQMGIIAHYQEINKLLEVYGYKDNEWQQFRKGINYEAFTVRRK